MAQFTIGYAHRDKLGNLIPDEDGPIGVMLQPEDDSPQALLEVQATAATMTWEKFCDYVRVINQLQARDN